jgi:hypothetical protein
VTSSGISLSDARTMSAGYSDSEDRIWLRFGAEEGAVQVWMTRRLLSRALPQIWSFMATHCTLPPGAAEDDAARQSALLAEREVALETKGADTEREARRKHPKAMEHRPVQAGMLSSILVERKGNKVRLNFLASGGQVGMVFGRVELHRMLNMLARRAESSGWNLDLPWQPD